MTPQQQAIALYEAMGWSKIEPMVVARDGSVFSGIDPQGRPSFVPPIDHNLLAQAREKLLVTDRLKEEYAIVLLENTSGFAGEEGWTLRELYDIANASLAQQLTALLKAAGLWKENV
jgi:hypothetical protein